MNKGFSALIPLIGGMEHAVWGIFEGVLGSDSRREWKGFIDDDMVYISGRQKITRKMLILIPTLDLSGGFFSQKVIPILGLLLQANVLLRQEAKLQD